MRALKYSILFAAMFYLAAMACNIAGLSDEQSGIPILVAVFSVLGLYIAGKNRGE